jgi:hypothetical protein
MPHNATDSHTSNPTGVQGVDYPYEDGSYTQLGARLSWLKASGVNWFTAIQSPPVDSKGLRAFIAEADRRIEQTLIKVSPPATATANDRYAHARMVDWQIVELAMLREYASHQPDDAPGVDTPPPAESKSAGAILKDAANYLVETESPWKWVGLGAAALAALFVVLMLVLVGRR